MERQGCKYLTFFNEWAVILGNDYDDSVDFGFTVETHNCVSLYYV